MIFVPILAAVILLGALLLASVEAVLCALCVLTLAVRPLRRLFPFAWRLAVCVPVSWIVAFLVYAFVALPIVVLAVALPAQAIAKTNGPALPTHWNSLGIADVPALAQTAVLAVGLVAAGLVAFVVLPLVCMALCTLWGTAIGLLWGAWAVRHGEAPQKRREASVPPVLPTRVPLAPPVIL
ncbi:MAG: hypothetical protein JNJ88_19370 [Planctomycetes bacterium]|nr:hypothetical protein [Planctomycetota bacterium]